VCITERRNHTFDGSLGSSGSPSARWRDSTALRGSSFRPPVMPYVADHAVARCPRRHRDERFQLSFKAYQSMITRRRDMRSAKTLPVPDTERIDLTGAAGGYDGPPADGGDGRHDRAVSGGRQSSVAGVRPTMRVPGLVVVRAIDLCTWSGGSCAQSREEG
jgi:hypothetical protein